METNDIIQRLNYIKNAIESEDYDKAIEQLEKTKFELLAEQNVVSEYMDDLVSNLK